MALLSSVRKETMPAVKERWLRRIFLALAALTLLLITSSIALADPDSAGTRLTLSLPTAATLGEPARIEAKLETGDGLPLPQAVVHFYISASFLSGSGGLMRIGEATTDKGGVAALDYVPRRGGEMDMVARYDGSDRYAPSQDITKFTVQGNEQLYTPESGIRLPFISKWFIVGVLSAIWGTFMFVGLLIFRVATASD
ncbi:MAG: hypothetical protein HY676_04465 [Chloroflexi bacterium]|nr:hypothetical protein [Chloroflexota bacterium]